MTATCRLPSSLTPPAPDYLHACARIYDTLTRLVERMDAPRNAEAVLRCVQTVASFAWHSHAGRYADGMLENPVLEIGKRLDSLCPRDCPGTDGPGAPPRRRERHVLHVATAVYPIGGHTRLLVNWMRNDVRSQHSVLLTRQSGGVVSGWLTDAVQESGGVVINLPDTLSLLAKARRTREVARGEIDLIVLHHHPDDPLPSVAFAVPGLPPVALLNHADHVFWLGSGVADAVLNIRESGRHLSERRRFTRKNLLLPIPLAPAVHEATRAEACNQLGITQDQLVLLSMGSASKYRPTVEANFFRAARAILEANPEAHLYLVGVSVRDVEELAPEHAHPRLHPLGFIENPSLYQSAADLYVEGFPHGSLTALLEAARRGIPCVGAVASGSPVLASDDVALTGLLATPSTEAAYVAQVTRLVRAAEERLRVGRAFRRATESCHCGDGWLEHLERVYEALRGVPHAPRPIPHSRFSATRDDTALSAMQEVTFNGTRLLQTLRRELSGFLPAGLLPVLRFALLFRDFAGREWCLELGRDLVKKWLRTYLGKSFVQLRRPISPRVQALLRWNGSPGGTSANGTLATNCQTSTPVPCETSS